MLTISRRMTSRFPKTITRNVTAETPRSGENGNSNSFASLRLRGRSLIRVRSVFDPWRNPQLVLRPILAFNRRRLAWAAVLLLLPLVRFDAAAAQGPDRVLGEPPPWKALKQKPKSTRTGPEKRIELGNQSLRLDFDPRSSDTSYNYLWIRRPDTGRWLRVHNFGIDVHAPKAGDNQDINCVGINLALRREANTVHVGYPRPIIQYRQFDEKVGRADRIRQYPEFTAKELPALVHSDAALEFQYQLDPERPSFTVRGRVLEGRLLLAIYIVDALWTDNHSLPTHEYLAGQAEYDIARPESVRCRDLRFKRVPGVCDLLSARRARRPLCLRAPGRRRGRNLQLLRQLAVPARLLEGLAQPAIYPGRSRSEGLQRHRLYRHSPRRRLPARRSGRLLSPARLAAGRHGTRIAEEDRGFTAARLSRTVRPKGQRHAQRANSTVKLLTTAFWEI